MRWLIFGCAGLLIGGVAMAQPGGRGVASRFQPERESAFESGLLREAGRRDAVHADIRAEPDRNNARGLKLSGGDAAVVGLEVTGRKYGVSLDGTGDVLIKNFVFRNRQAKDIFGAGLILGQKEPTRGETWLSNAWIDLEGRGPIADYKQANNEAISVEQGNGPLNVRRAVLVGGEESGLDNKGDVRMDAVFIASGHRSVRVWGGARLVIANSIVLANKGHTGIWFGGEDGEARFEYYNCLFGEVGDRWEDLSRDPPDWMVQREDDVPVRMRRLERDPFQRGGGSFWTPTEAPVPPGYLRGRG
jgi:hypothetical protein